MAPLHLPWIRQSKDWFRPLLDQKHDNPRPTAVPRSTVPTVPRVAALSLGTNATKPNVINQTNRVYGSRGELLNPAWQLINELIRLCGERGAGLSAQLQASRMPWAQLRCVPFPSRRQTPEAGWVGAPLSKLLRLSHLGLALPDQLWGLLGCALGWIEAVVSRARLVPLKAWASKVQCPGFALVLGL